MNAETRAQAPVTRISERSVRIAAGKIGCTAEEYRHRVANDEYWCGLGKHWVTREEFSIAVKGTRSGRCHECRSLKSERDSSPAYRLTPEGMSTVAHPSGRIYRQIEHLRPMQSARLERMRDLLGVPVTGVVCVEAAV